MTSPVPGPTTTDLVRAFVEVTHEALTRAEAAEAEQAECQKLADALGLDNRALKDRLRERDATIAQQGRTQTDSDRLVKRLRETDQPLAASTDRPHTGPPGRCQCGPVHSSGQAISLNAAGRDRIEPKT